MPRTANDNRTGAPSGRVCVGVVVGVHGVRGTLRIKPFTQVPEDVAAYGPVTDAHGTRHLSLTAHGLHKGTVLATADGIAERETALGLKGLRLYVARSALPALAEPETFYHADLIGLRVLDTAGRDLGEVVAVQDFGAGDLLELRQPGGGERLLPFTRAVVPEVDIASGRLVADPPPETGDAEGGGPEGDEDRHGDG